MTGVLYVGDALKVLRTYDDACVDVTVTSPPYNIGKEYEKRVAIEKYVEWITPIVAEIVRVTKPGGSICWQVGNHITRRPIPRTHLRYKVPERTRAEVLPLDYVFYPIFQELGMTLRARTIWQFGHGLHAKHRFSGRHEAVLWFTKGATRFDVQPVQEAFNDVWSITNVKSNHPEKTEHPCQLPQALVARLLVALVKSKHDVVLDPFAGAGTVAFVAAKLGCRSISVEIDKGYADIAVERLNKGGFGKYFTVARAA